MSISSIVNSIKSRLPKASTVVTKGLGAAGLGYVLYDSHYVGKMQSDLYASERDASYTTYFLNNAMHNSSMSKIQDKIKNASFTTELDTTWKRFFNEGIGYIKGFTSMLIDHVVPLGLSIGALFTKGFTAKASAIGLGIYGGYVFLKNFFGVGTPPGIRKIN